MCMKQLNSVRIIGHRGAAGTVFENTTESILAAIHAGVCCIEIDVWKTRDGELILFHDAYLERLTDQKGFIRDLDYKSIQNIRLRNNASIPTLKEIITIAKTHDIKLLVEVKDENVVIDTYNLLNSEMSFKNFIIGSFFHKPICELKTLYPQVQTSIMLEAVPVGFEDYLKRVNPDYVTVSVQSYNDYLINSVKKQGRKLIFYTINTESEMERMIQIKPWAIVTDYPERFIKQ
ncbi:MAG TPA: hypothetical protein ENO01_02950 [Candidatus Marinimicrobia bacterium]|nr:hypothetical protein [Candidatus Neomarinimicrobiota bacterium]